MKFEAGTKVLGISGVWKDMEMVVKGMASETEVNCDVTVFDKTVEIRLNVDDIIAQDDADWMDELYAEDDRCFGKGK